MSDPLPPGQQVLRAEVFLEKLAALRERLLARENSLLQRIEQLEKTVDSAEKWQRRSWFWRLTHRWQATEPAARLTGDPVLREIAIFERAVAQIRQRGERARLERRLQTVFNAPYYLAKNPAATRSDLSPLEHYRTIGWKQHSQPHPLFDVAWYLQQNPAVAAVGAEPLEHYLETGWKLGHFPHRFFDPRFYQKRAGLLRNPRVEPLGHYLKTGWKRNFATTPAGAYHWLEELPGLAAMIAAEEAESFLGREFSVWNEQRDPAKPVILLIVSESNDASAVTFLLNLARKWRPRYEIVLLDLCEGSLQNECQAACGCYLGLGTKENTQRSFFALTLRLLLERCPIYFAVIHSLAVARALPVLALKNIPMLQLIPENPSLSAARRRLRWTLFHAGHVICPTPAVLQNLLERCSDFSGARTSVLRPATLAPDGRATAEEEARRARQLLRPPGWEDAVIVLGVGQVAYRQGVDVFLMCAEKMVRQNPPGAVRFVWLGAGRKDDASGYALFVEEQLRRSQMESAVVIFDETAQPQLAYAAADLCLICAREEAVSIAAQEAMQHGVPVVCFAGSTSVAEVLGAEPVVAACVVPRLDVSAACEPLQRLIDDPVLRKNTGSQMQLLAREHFDFQKSADAHEAAALRQIEVVQQEAAQRAYLRAAGVLDLPYFRTPLHPEMWVDPVWWYVRSWSSGVYRRKPFPGFHPGVYAVRQGLKGDSLVDPLVHYLQAGRPAGPWNLPVIQPRGAIAPAVPAAKAALHIHLFYAEMADDIARRLSRNQAAVDLFISVPDEASRAIAQETFGVFPASKLRIEVTPNVGRDIGPLLTAFGGVAFAEYEMVGHLHTKRSLHTGRNRADLWTELLFENMLGGKFPMLDVILNAMQADPRLGIVYPDDPNIYGWRKNRSHAEQLVQKMNLDLVLPEEIDFPAGTFFWARTAALKSLFDLELQWTDYPPEPAPLDETLLHAIERLLPTLAAGAGFHSALTYVEGITY